MEGRYSDNTELDARILAAVGRVEQGDVSGLTAMIKTVKTGILRADPSHPETRYQPGKKLVTYIGVKEDGSPIKETWGGGVAEIKEDSVILRNVEPIRYAKEHALEGREVRGFYNEEGAFAVDQKSGDTTLFNEYVSTVKFVAGDPTDPSDRGAYGVQPTLRWQEALKLQPSYAFSIPPELGAVTVRTEPGNDGVEIHLTGGDYVVVDLKKLGSEDAAKSGKVNKITSVHGGNKEWIERTYANLEDHLRGLQKMEG